MCNIHSSRILTYCHQKTSSGQDCREALNKSEEGWTFGPVSCRNEEVYGEGNICEADPEGNG